jgi:hypothetical protein
MPSSLVAIDTSGRTFQRMSSLRQSAALRSAEPAGSEKQKSSREKRFRRQTISGIPVAIAAQLKTRVGSQSSVSSSMASEATQMIGRPQTLNLGRPSRMAIRNLQPSLSFEDDIPLSLDKTSPIPGVPHSARRSMSYREPTSRTQPLNSTR